MLKISIIIPNYNMSSYIIDTLTSLENQSLDKKLYEVIIVDNNSTDNSYTLIDNFIKDKNNYHLISEKQQGPSFCRNLGIKLSKSDLIFFTDADCKVENNILEKIVIFFQDNKDISIVGGPVYHYHKDIINLAYHYFRFGFILDNKNKYVDYLTTSNLAFRKSIFYKENIFFNTDLPVDGAEDTFLCLKFREKNYSIINETTFKVYHIPFFTFFSSLEKTYKIAKNYSLIQFKIINEEIRILKKITMYLKLFSFPLTVSLMLLGIILFLFYLKKLIFFLPTFIIIFYAFFILFRAAKRYKDNLKKFNNKYLIIGFMFMLNIYERTVYFLFFYINLLKLHF